jgi:LytR cell envelope-related transcriptional attenuator
MRTDDVLADLGAQLRDARPVPRRPPVRAGLAVVAAALLVGLVVALGAGGGDRGREQAAPSAATATATPTAAAGSTRVAVLNGTRTAGLATQAARQLQEGGFEVVGVANAPRRDRMSTLVAARSPRQAAAARSVAAALGVRDAANVATGDLLRVAGRRAQVVVVLGELSGPCVAQPTGEVVASIAALRSGAESASHVRYPSQVAHLADRARVAGAGVLVAAGTLCRRGPGACLELRAPRSSATGCGTLGDLRRHGVTISDGRRVAILVADGVRAVRATVTRGGRPYRLTLPVRDNIASTTGSKAAVSALRS